MPLKRVLLSLLALAAPALLWWLVQRGVLPPFLLWVVGGLSGLTFILYGLDKRAARREAQRTPEATLHWLAFLGGWPGALLAQQVFRHKSGKRRFQVVFWILVILHCSVLALWAVPVARHYVICQLQKGEPGCRNDATSFDQKK